MGANNDTPSRGVRYLVHGSMQTSQALPQLTPLYNGCRDGLGVNGLNGYSADLALIPHALQDLE